MVKAKQDTHKFQYLMMDLLNDKFEEGKNIPSSLKGSDAFISTIRNDLAMRYCLIK